MVREVLYAQEFSLSNLLEGTHHRVWGYFSGHIFSEYPFAFLHITIHPF